MTHSEPISVITTSIDGEDQRHDASSRPPTAVFMCRKYTMCTTIWTAANAMIDHAGRRSCCRGRRLITSQKGIAVRITDRPKPIR